MKRIFMMVLAVVLCGSFTSGCASKRYYPVDSRRTATPASSSSAPRYEDPAVEVARSLARQVALDRIRWQRACLELRSNDPYATYADCRKVFGDDRKIGYDYGFGDSFRIQRR